MESGIGLDFALNAAQSLQPAEVVRRAAPGITQVEKRVIDLIRHGTVSIQMVLRDKVRGDALGGEQRTVRIDLFSKTAYKPEASRPEVDRQCIFAPAGVSEEDGQYGARGNNAQQDRSPGPGFRMLQGGYQRPEQDRQEGRLVVIADALQGWIQAVKHEREGGDEQDGRPSQRVEEQRRQKCDREIKRARFKQSSPEDAGPGKGREEDLPRRIAQLRKKPQ